MSGLVKWFKWLVIPTGMELNTSSVSVEIWTTYQLIPVFTPSNPTNNKIYWTSSNTSVATVNDRWLVTPVSPWNAIITAVADYWWYTDTCDCQIFKIDVTWISLNENSIVLWEWDTFQLEATIIPSDASLKWVVWSSSNTNYATVDETWLVTYVAPWDCTITVTTVDWWYTATCACSSRIRVTWLELNNTSINVKAWKTFQLEATITPDNATLKTVTWNSSNTSVATVSQNWLVTYVWDGNCTITATTVDWWYTAVCEVECTSFTPIDCCFWYTWAQQGITLEPHTYCIEVWWASWWTYWSAAGKWWYAGWCITLTNATCLYIYVWWCWTYTFTNSGCNPWWWNWGWNWYNYSTTYIWPWGWWWTDVRIWGNTLYHRRIVAGWGWGWWYYSSCSAMCWWAGWWANWVQWWNYSSRYWGNWWTQTSWWSNSRTCCMVTWSFWQGWYKTSWYGWYNWSWGWGGWYWGWAWSAVSAWGWGWSWYVYTSSTCSSAPSWYCHCTAYYFTNSCCCCWIVSFPSPSWWTETWHSWCGCVRIRSID